MCYINIIMKKYTVLLLNGPNLQLLGMREPEIYGRTTLADIVCRVKELGGELGCEVVDYQSNVEGFLVDRIAQAYSEKFDGIIFNPAAYTHTSVALRDALAAVKIPTVEVHLSNIASRDEFRHNSLTLPVSLGVIAGFGADGYLLALRALVSHLEKQEHKLS